MEKDSTRKGETILNNIKTKTKYLTLSAMIGAIYAVLTLINPLSFGAIQLRFSTLLLPLATFVPQVRIGLVLGTIIGNMNSSLGMIDIVVGAVVTYIAVYQCSKIRNKLIRAFAYALESGILVGLELYYCFKVPIVYNIITVGISGFVLYFVGIYVMEVVSNAIHKVFDKPI